MNFKRILKWQRREMTGRTCLRWALPQAGGKAAGATEPATGAGRGHLGSADTLLDSLLSSNSDLFKSYTRYP